MQIHAKLKVETLDEHRLSDASATLAAKVAKVDNIREPLFKPDILIGIRSGGYVVAEAMAPTFPEAKLFPITCQRSSTKKKQKSSLLKNLLRKLPESLTNPLRIVEHIVLTQLRSPKKEVFTPNKQEVAAIEKFLRRYKGNPNILIIDDAVDGGATLANVVQVVKKLAGAKATIKTAVITVTTQAPFIEPDFLLYRYVLCRFPWSFDFKH